MRFATVAIGAALAIACSGQRTNSPGVAAPVQRLIDEIGRTRPFEARLPGTRWTALGEYRSGAPFRPEPGLTIAAATVEAAARDSDAPEDTAALGLAYLALGRTEDATLLLETTTRSDPRHVDPGWWVALSAARLTLGRQTGDRLDFAIAMDVAARAVPRRVHLQEALFDRALAAQALNLRQIARRDLQLLLQLEHDRGWREEVQSRLASLETARSRAVASPSLPRQRLEELLENVMPAWERAGFTGDRAAQALQRAHADRIAAALESVGDRFAARVVGDFTTRAAGGRDWSDFAAARQLSDSHPADAARSLRATTTRAGRGTPAWIASTLSLASAALDAGDVTGARTAVIAARPYIHSDEPLLRGAAARLEGRLAAADNDAFGAVARYRDAAHEYDRVGERASAATVRAGLCYFLHVLGDHRQEWEERARAVDALESVSDPLDRYLIAASAALGAQRERLFALAVELQHLAVQLAARLTDPLYHVEALGNRAGMRADAGDAAESAGDARSALAALQQLPDSAPVRLLRANVSLHLPLSASAPEAAENAARLSAAIDHYKATGREELLAVAYHRRGLAYIAFGQRERALADFGAGAAAFASGSRAAPDPVQKARYFESAMDLLDGIAGTGTDSASFRMVMALADEVRAAGSGRDRRSAGGPPSLPDPATLLPRDTALLYYVTLRHRLLILAIGPSGPTMTSVPVDRLTLAWLIARAQREMEARGAATTASASLARLHEILIRPAAGVLNGTRHLIVSLDAGLAGVAFPALYESSIRSAASARRRAAPPNRPR